MKTVIMAGGKGTRIASVASDIPKPMLPIAGKPVLEHEIKCLEEQGFNDIIISVSHLADSIIQYFGDGGKFGVHIEYYFESNPLGNAGALFEIKDKLTDDFLLINADSIFNVDLKRFVRFHSEHSGLASLLTHPNSHPYDSALIEIDDKKCVSNWYAKEDIRPRYYNNRVNAGIHILSPKLLANRPDTEKIDLDRQILKPLAGTGKLYAYDSPEYVKDMGTPQRFAAVVDDFTSGRIFSKNLTNMQRAVFLDRDGIINKYVGFLRDIDDFELLPGVYDAINIMHSKGYLVIVVTNQPVIARGEVSLKELDEIHKKLETLLGEQGAYIDALYYCPHHPDKGFAGERPEYKIDCDCRKPKPGMLLKAAQDFNIDLAQSYMIGDGENDVAAGKNAGCKSILIKTDTSLLNIIGEIQ